MTIAVDASRSVSTIQKTGVEKVSDELLKHFLWLSSRAVSEESHGIKQIDLIFYTPREISWLPKENQKILYWPFKFFWTQIRLAWELIFHPPQIMFFPVHTMPIILFFLSFRPKWRNLKKTDPSTPLRSARDDKKRIHYYKIIHDIAFKKQPKLYSWKQRLILNLDLWFSLKLCTKIFVPSEAVRQDIFSYCHPRGSEDPSDQLTDKIIVTHWGYKKENNELRIMSARGGSAFDGNYGKKKKQFLYIGRVEEKKNINNLIKAFKTFHQKNPDYKLVLAGKIISDSSRDSRFRGNDNIVIKFLGYVSEEKKRELLRESVALVHVPFEEGFGFPILEAFDFGLPVIASDIPVLREIGDDACIYVNPNSTEEIAACLEKITNDENLRKKTIEQGCERLKQFSWQQTAKKILNEITQNDCDLATNWYL